jgi:uncharacterized protein (DUF1697 family)
LSSLSVALLRSINLGGHKSVRMNDLRDVFTGLGFDQVRSLLQTGNVIFESGSQTTARVEERLETAINERLALETDFFVRSAAEWKAIVAHNPFRVEAGRDPAHLLVVFLKDTPGPSHVAALRAAISGRERVATRGRQAYIVYPDGIGRSRVTISLIERKLATRGTGRNWNTVLKIADLLRQ